MTLMDGMEVKMEYNVEEKGGVLVVALIGRLVAACTEEVMEAITPRMGENPKMVLDLSRMSHIDSSGLGMLVKLLQRATDKGGVVKIACLQSHPRIVFDTFIRQLGWVHGRRRERGGCAVDAGRRGELPRRERAISTERAGGDEDEDGRC